MKKIISMTLEETTVTGLDGYKTETVSRSELVDEVLKHTLQSPEFMQAFVKNIESRIRNFLPETTA